MTLRPVEKLYPFRGNVRTVAPAIEPVTADDLRTHVVETEAALPDAQANMFIAVARESIEEYTGLALITQTWKLVYDQWPRSYDNWWNGVRQGAISEIEGSASNHAMIIPRYPLQSVPDVTVYAENGSPTVVDVAATFDIDTYQRPGRIALKYGATWPIVGRRTNGVEITYVCGYGDEAADVPEALKMAIMMMASHLYAHKGDGCSTDDALSKSGAMSLVDKYKAARI